MTESQYQSKLIKRLERRFPGCMIVKSDPQDQQGIPDFFLLYNHMWAALEVKTSAKAHVQPNQNHFVNTLNHMSFAAFIHPENEKEVLDALQQAFESPWGACVP